MRRLSYGLFIFFGGLQVNNLKFHLKTLSYRYHKFFTIIWESGIRFSLCYLYRYFTNQILASIVYFTYEQLCTGRTQECFSKGKFYCRDPNSRSEGSTEREEEGRRRGSSQQHSHQGPFPYWEKYDPVNQLYLDLGESTNKYSNQQVKELNCDEAKI